MTAHPQLFLQTVKVFHDLAQNPRLRFAGSTACPYPGASNRKLYAPAFPTHKPDSPTYTLPQNHNQITSFTIFSDSLSDIGNVNLLLEILSGNNEDTSLLFKPVNAHYKHSDIIKLLKYLGIHTTDIAHAESLLAKDFIQLLNKVYAVPVYPDSRYYKGRFSNGPVFNEWLALNLGIDVSNPEKYINRAYGGSWAVSLEKDIDISWKHLKEDIVMMIDGKLIPPNLGRLVSAYLDEYPESVNHQNNPDGGQAFGFLYGANDYISGFSKSKDVVDSINGQVERVAEYLATAPARLPNWIFIANLPAIEKSPRLLRATPKERERVSALVSSHNELLKAAYEKLKTTYQGRINFRFIDTYTLFNEELASGEYKNITDPCYDSDLPALHSIRFRKQPVSVDTPTPAAPCKNPQDYAFWDELHPSAKMHARLSWKLCETVFQEAGAHCTGIPPFDKPEEYPDSAHNP